MGLSLFSNNNHLLILVFLLRITASLGIFEVALEVDLIFFADLILSESLGLTDRLVFASIATITVKQRGLGFGVWGLGFGVWEIGRAHV